jgi:hypothetical protein
MIEGSGSIPVPLTSGSGSGRQKTGGSGSGTLSETKHFFVCYTGRAAGLAGGPGPRDGGPQQGRIHRLPRVYRRHAQADQGQTAS